MYLNQNLNTIVTVFGIVLLGAVFFAYVSILPSPETFEFKEIPRFESYEAMVAALEESGGRNGGIMEDMVTGFPAPMAQKSLESGGDYSTTNIQVAGVDEADIVKSDGKYIYALSGNKLIITKAYPIETSEIMSNKELEITPVEMFVRNDKLLVFGSRYEEYDEGHFSQMEMPYYRSNNFTVAELYDISDKTNPVLEKTMEFEGNYLTSRMIEENAYFVVNSWPRYWVMEGNENGNIIPIMRENGVEKRIAEATEIGYLPPMPASNFITIVSLNLETEENSYETIVGSAGNVFASQKNIYLAATAWLPPEGVPVIKDVERIIIGDEEKTVINKFGLASGQIGFLGQGQVPGHVLNQFSMDEFEGNFRIATTAGRVSRGGGQSTNNLYVLDGEMNLIGSLEDLAPGEKIYSARFMGKKAYMVTFRKIDPLFVIDVSDPTNPRVLGKLKIPGYSDYLHPIDETHLIGVGKETIESTYGDFAWYQGLKMAVFDVSDVANPKEMHKIVIGDRGTDSYALHDHKAFLYDKEKELLVLPIMLAEIPEEQKKPLEDETRSPSYGEHVFQGAFVFRLTLENGFEETGRITHLTPEDELKRGYYFGNEYSVQRSMYIGNVLYTYSQRMLKANALDTLQDLKEFSFE